MAATDAKRFVAHPCLPDQLLDALKSTRKTSYDKSNIWAVPLEDWRVKTLSNAIFCNDVAEEVIASVRKRRGDTFSDAIKLGASGQTYLHIAAIDGDLALAYECIRLGVGIDNRDSEGRTALLLACESGFLASTSQNAKDPKLTGLAVGCSEVAGVLVRQQADVNFTVRDMTPLRYAVRAKAWKHIETLLEHGADPRPGGRDLSTSFSNSDDRSKFNTLVQKHASKPRPPRRCPCWSGAWLSECHTVDDFPYPLNFLCRCNSGKIQWRCCVRRGIGSYERWDEKEQRLMVKVLKPEIKFELPEQSLAVTHAALLDYAMKQNPKTLWTSPMLKAYARQMHLITETMVEEGRADPAYCFAARCLPFLVFPFDREFCEPRNNVHVNKWNDAIDLYYFSQKDKRPKLQLEQAGKVDMDGGPMFRRCESYRCLNVESPTRPKYKRCSQCQRIFYCSPACQKVDWNVHKVTCQERTHSPQKLYSQVAIIKALYDTRLECLHRIQQLNDVKDAFTGDMMDAAGVWMAMPSPTYDDALYLTHILITLHF
ncbi:unnamed protein product [Somion occarium]|uniref:MYND-type domain-containing protein n=1 Tax=Somion occarium TaxID=3059160 RepID=A0ABP1EA35_9APHY